MVADYTGWRPLEDHASSVACLVRNMEAVAEFGGKIVTMAEGAVPSGADPDDVWRKTVAAFKEVAKIGEKLGIKMVNEYHPCLMASTVEKAAKLIDDVGSPAFQACVDFCHTDVITGGKSVEMIKTLKGRIGHVHIADGDGLPNMHLPVGEGRVDVSVCLQAVKEAGYDGDFSLCLWGFNFPELAIRNSAPRVKALLNPR